MENSEIEHNLSFEYNEITPQIFLGTTVCCQTHFDKELLERGITADISLEGEKLDSPYGVEFFLWIPVADHNTPTSDQFDLGVDLIDKIVNMGKKVYIHCKFGHGRGPTMLAAYFIYLGDSTEDALKKIKEKRNVIHPNPLQIKVLKDFEKKIKR